MRSQATRLVIVGAGGFGRELLAIVGAINATTPTFEFVGFVDDGPVRTDLLERLRAPMLGPTSRLGEIAADYVIGIAAAQPRRRIDAAACSSGCRAATLVHPMATVGSDIEFGEGVVVAAGVRLSTHIVVGRHGHLNVSCTIGHDVVIEDFVTLFPGVHLGGGCVIEEDATLGTGCAILPGVRVGRGAVVGAGAVVVRDVAPDTTVVTSPARPTLRTNLVPDSV